MAGVEMGKDLGTYWLLVEFEDGRGYLQKFETCRSYTHGTESLKPLEGVLIPPPWADEQEIFSAMEYQYLNGNYSCDCNKAMFLARAYQCEEQDDQPCGDTMTLRRLTAIRPDGSERVLWEASSGASASSVLRQDAMPKGAAMRPSAARRRITDT